MDEARAKRRLKEQHLDHATKYIDTSIVQINLIGTEPGSTEKSDIIDRLEPFLAG